MIDPAVLKRPIVKERFVVVSGAKAARADRVIFFDNLRYLFVLCVVMQHAGNAYTGMDWWPIRDGNAGLIVQLFTAFGDAFTMPLLFYISGYFALPAIRKYGAGRFLSGKLRRLGIPWLVCILTVCPILPLVYHYTRNQLELPTGYWDIWLEVMKNGLQGRVGLVTSMNDLMMNNQFYQRYMWFLSLLILFFFIFAGLYLWRRGWFDADMDSLDPARPTAWSTMKMLLAVGLLCVLLTFVPLGLILAFGPKTAEAEPLFTLGNIIQFRPSRLGFFIVYFSLGVLTCRNRWIERGRFPGHLRTWAVSFIVLLAGLFSVVVLMQYGPGEPAEAYGPIYFLILNFLTMATLGFFSSLGQKYWNRPTAFDRKMSAQSYNIYLGHYLFVIAAQLLLLFLPGLPGLLKFALVAVAGVLGGYGAGRFLIAPHPRTTVVVMFGILLFMALGIRP